MNQSEYKTMAAGEELFGTEAVVVFDVGVENEVDMTMVMDGLSWFSFGCSDRGLSGARSGRRRKRR